MQLSNKTLALGGLILTNLFWAGNAVLARFVTDDIPPLTLSFGRWLLAFLFLLPFAWPHLRGKMAGVYRQWPVIVVLSLLGISIYNTVLYLAAHSTTAINITLVGSALPLVTLLGSWLLLSERPSHWQLIGIAASLLGVLMIIGQGDINIILALEYNHGDLLILGIVCCWSLYSVILRKYPVNLHPLALLTLLMGMGLPLLAVFFVLEWSLLPVLQFELNDIPLFFYTAIFPSILAYLFWGFGIKVVGPNITSLSCYLMPLFTALLAVPLLGEVLYWYHFLGGLLVLIGLYLGSVFNPSDWGVLQLKLNGKGD